MCVFLRTRGERGNSEKNRGRGGDRYACHVRSLLLHCAARAPERQVLAHDADFHPICFLAQSTLHCSEWLFVRRRLETRSGACQMNLVTVMKRPSAFLPVAMSFAALVLVLGNIAIFGVVHEADEGTTAHIFQLLIAGQVPIVAFFAIKWLPQTPKQALQVLALQAGAGLAALAPVFFF